MVKGMFISPINKLPARQIHDSNHLNINIEKISYTKFINENTTYFPNH